MAAASTQIPLDQWAEDNEVSFRTACDWARNGKLKAKKKTVKKEVTRTVAVTKWFIASNARKPKQVK